MKNLIQFVYPDYTGEDPDPERVEYAIKRIIDGIVHRSHEPEKSVKIYDAILRRNLLNGEKMPDLAEELHISNQYLYSARKKVARMMLHPSIRKLIFDDEYYNAFISGKLEKKPRELKEHEKFINSLDTTVGRGLARTLIYEVLCSDESYILDCFKISDLVTIAPPIFLSIPQRGRVAVNDVLRHVGDDYIHEWWPGLTIDLNEFDMFDLCEAWAIVSNLNCGNVEYE